MHDSKEMPAWELPEAGKTRGNWSVHARLLFEATGFLQPIRAEASLPSMTQWTDAAPFTSRPRRE